MKRVLIILLILIVAIYCFESSDWTNSPRYQPELSVVKMNDNYVLSWPKLPYYLFYIVEAIPNANHSSSVARPIKYKTRQNTFTIGPNIPLDVFWRVSAQGLFQRPLGEYSNIINISQIKSAEAKKQKDIKPQVLSHYPQGSPASPLPLLLWSKVPGAVKYNLELFTKTNNKNTGASLQKIYSTNSIYSNGYVADLRPYRPNTFYWHVRALDLSSKPISNYSRTEEIHVNKALPIILKPYTTAELNQNGMATPLYPAYAWIPTIGAVFHEIEITNQAPENNHDDKPSQYRIWSKIVESAYDCYDEEARITPGTYYWRIRGLDEEKNPIGIWSDPSAFIVDLKKGNYAATFGDSITHGGGGISYSPADIEFNFQTYLNFPVVNLGKSGDTSETMAERFDSDVLPFQPKYLIILGGTNSLRGGVPASNVIQDLLTIKQKCLDHNIRPIFLTLPPINPRSIDIAFQEGTTENWRVEFDKVNIFIRNQPYYIDIEPLLSNSNRELPQDFALDGLHPDVEAKKFMAWAINKGWQRVTR